MATSAAYRWDMVSALPPMPRTRELGVAEAFLREIRDRPDHATIHDSTDSTDSTTDSPAAPAPTAGSAEAEADADF
jgi:hypothetical protein